VVALLSTRSFATFSCKVTWFTIVKAFILLLVVCMFFFHELGSETLFSSVGEIYQEVFYGGFSCVRALRVLR
jgi:hypothetical protein